MGDGPLRPELEEIVRQYGNSQIEFCGTTSSEDVLELMQQASMLLVPSNCYEGLPLTIVEAFSRGLPVITSNLGAMTEIVKHGETGLHFNPHAADDLAHWVRWAWEHPYEMELIAERAYQEYQTKYSPATNYQRLMEIYQQAMLGSGAGS